MENIVNFRAYIKEYNKIYRVYNLMENGDRVEVIDINGNFVGDGFYKNEFVLMQSTDFIDKNNKIVYEGDVVIGNCQQFVVCFQDCQFVLKKIHRYEDKEYDYSLCCFDKHDIEVIGNIYENQELLKE